jgi:hypothetical protein
MVIKSFTFHETGSEIGRFSYLKILIPAPLRLGVFALSAALLRMILGKNPQFVPKYIDSPLFHSVCCLPMTACVIPAAAWPAAH